MANILDNLTSKLEGLDVTLQQKLFGKKAGSSAFEKMDKANYIKLANMNLQLKDRLKFFILPSVEAFSKGSYNPSKGLSPFSDIGNVFNIANASVGMLGNYVTTLYLQEITFPLGPVIEYEEFTKRPKALQKPDSITFTFLEDEKGTVLRYMQIWRKTIVYVGSNGGWTSALSNNSEYVFADNQEATERIGILLLNSANKKKFTFPRIMFYGLKFKDMGQLTVGYNQKDNLTYTVTCSIREVSLPII